jgi:hypothetical protein
MTRDSELRPEFVDVVPEELEQGVLYISMAFKVAIHLCACGECKQDTVTPFNNPTNDWTLTNEDGLITLHPSIGNFQMPCKSHYWVKKNKIEWC